jgi:hypothetical protein
VNIIVENVIMQLLFIKMKNREEWMRIVHEAKAHPEL